MTKDVYNTVDITLGCLQPLMEQQLGMVRLLPEFTKLQRNPFSPFIARGLGDVLREDRNAHKSAGLGGIAS
jgi:hypothetical protein